MTQDDWIKIIGGIVGGGFLGAIYTNWRLDHRNKIQPVDRKLSISHIDLPTIMKDYSALISLKKHSHEETQPYYFKQLGIIQLELINTGNKDIDKFEFGINIPEENQIIGFQNKAPDRMHNVLHTPEISIITPTNQIDVTLQPFSRNNRYEITLVVNAKDRLLEENIQLSHALPVRFVEIDKTSSKDFAQEYLIKMIKAAVITLTAETISIISYIKQPESLLTLFTAVMPIVLLVAYAMVFLPKRKNKN